MEGMDTSFFRAFIILVMLAFLQQGEAWGQFDFGDAPATYQTLLPSGARHTIVIGGPRLGSLIDPEADGQPGLGAQGDDSTTLDDEDGVVGPVQWEANTLVTLQITVNQACRLDAWVDWRRDTSWAGGLDDTFDQIALARPLQAGVNSVSVFVPPFAVPGVTYARFRVSTTGGLSTGGLASDGEVEDYAVLITSATLETLPRLEYVPNALPTLPVIRWLGNPAYSSQMEQSADLVTWNTFDLPKGEVSGVNEVTVQARHLVDGKRFFRLVRRPLYTTPIPLPPPGNEESHQFKNLTFVHGGIMRSYRLKLPNTWTPAQSWPLVMLLPGHGQSVDSFWNLRSEMLPMANGGNGIDACILCFAEATSGDSDHAWFTYNDPRPSYPSLDLPWIDDYTFIKALTQWLIDSGLNIDTHRMYCGGFSNGANMTHFIASKADRPFAAFAMIDGGVQLGVRGAPATTPLLADTPLPVLPRPVLINNQLDSTAWPYEGEPLVYPSSYNFGVPSPGARSTVARWATTNGVSGAAANHNTQSYTTPTAGSISTFTWNDVAGPTMAIDRSDLRPDIGWPGSLVGSNGWTTANNGGFALYIDPRTPASLRSQFPHTIAPHPTNSGRIIVKNGTWTREIWTPSMPGSNPANTVELITMSTGGHNWPEADSPWDGEREVLIFFQNHPLP